MNDSILKRLFPRKRFRWKDECVDTHVRGDLRFTGWGSEYGFPAFTWRPDGPKVPVKLFTSHDLAGDWRRLDKFEGAGYCRILVPIEDDSGVVAVANLYAERSPGKGGGGER